VRYGTSEYCGQDEDTVSRLGLAFLLVVLGTAVAVSAAAAAEPLRANVVSWSSDRYEPGVPQSIVFRLYEPQLPSPDWGKPISDANDVEVVIHGQGQTQRFPAEDLGGGRYRTTIAFPERGGWSVGVRYGAGSYGTADEVPLGKGGICIVTGCDGPPPGEPASPAGSGWPWTMTIIAGAAVLLGLVVVLAVRLVRFGAIRLLA
jgi:hypothetical protein